MKCGTLEIDITVTKQPEHERFIITVNGRNVFYLTYEGRVLIRRREEESERT
jgi:hypothetical protein